MQGGRRDCPMRQGRVLAPSRFFLKRPECGRRFLLNLSPPLVVDVLLACSGLFLLNKALFSSKQKNPPLPPGPKRKALIGNLLDLPKPGEQEWVHWTKHKDLYGVFGRLVAIRASE